MSNEIKWLCENASRLEKFSGQCVVFSVKEGVLSQGSSLEQALKSTQSRKIAGKSFLFHVPSKDECMTLLPGTPQA